MADILVVEVRLWGERVGAVAPLHQMLVNGKAQQITRADLLIVAKQFDIDGANRLLDHIADVLHRWPGFARLAGVPDSEISRIAERQQIL